MLAELLKKYISTRTKKGHSRRMCLFLHVDHQNAILLFLSHFDFKIWKDGKFWK